MKLGIITLAAEFELPYLKEWLDYHYQIGIDKIFLGLNNWNPDKIPVWLEGYGKDRLKVYAVEGQKMQLPYLNGMKKRIDDMDYIIDIDVDEFIVSKKPIKDIIASLEQKNVFDSIYLNWRLYGDSGLHFTGVYNVLNRFTKADKKLHKLGKHIVSMKNKDSYFHDPHILLIQKNVLAYNIDTLGNYLSQLPNTIEPEEGQVIEIAHFRNKTWEEHINRKYYQDDVFYGEADFSKDLTKLRELFDKHNTNDIEKKVGIR